MWAEIINGHIRTIEYRMNYSTVLNSRLENIRKNVIMINKQFNWYFSSQLLKTIFQTSIYSF